jgi:hypothetical protein
VGEGGWGRSEAKVLFLAALYGKWANTANFSSCLDTHAIIYQWNTMDSGDQWLQDSWVSNSRPFVNCAIWTWRFERCI